MSELDTGVVAEQVKENGLVGGPEGGPEVGRARRRKEDARLITGRTQWTDNIQLPGMLHVAFLRSPMAHARITHVDTSGARSQRSATPGPMPPFSRSKPTSESQIGAW